MVYQIEILDKNRNLVAPIQVLAPINSSQDTIFFTYRLSNWGQLKFRVGTKDPIFDAAGDVLEPHKYHVRLKRYGSVIWQGVIVKNPERNRRYVEVVAYGYLFLLNKILIRHDASVTAGDGLDNYRTFKTGTMATAIQGLLTDAIADVGSGPITSITTGTIENPDFPANYTKADNTALTGTWTFSSDMTLQYDYRSVFYVINSMAMYPACDFELTKDLVFNFKQFIGNKQPTLSFTYGEFGNVLDYNLPRDGDRMANSLIGVAADFGNQILHVEENDNVSQGTYGKIQDVAAYIDVKNKNALRSRLTEELRLISVPDSELQLTLNDRAYPLGQIGIGDIVRVKIDDHVVSFDQQRRIVGINVSVSNNGSDKIVLMTNKPKEGI